MSLYVYIQVPGADPSNPGTQERIAVEFEAGSLPKLQSFKSAVHSNGKYRLLVGGRYIATAQSACIDCLPATFCLLFRLAGLHPFNGVGFTNQLESHVLFVLDTTNYITIAAALPEQYYNTVGLMNAQSYQLVHNGKNYLYIVGGYGYSPSAKTMITLNTVSCCALHIVGRS